MPRTTVEVTVEVEVEYDIHPAEPDTGILNPYVGEMEFYINGQLVDLGNALSTTQLVSIAEECLYAED